MRYGLIREKSCLKRRRFSLLHQKAKLWLSLINKAVMLR